MKTGIYLSHAVGKTLLGVGLSLACGQMVLTFTDGTFTTIEIDDSNRETLGDDRLDLDEFGDDILIRLGIVTGEELSMIRSAERANQEANAVAWKRAQFDRLKIDLGL